MMQVFVYYWKMDVDKFLYTPMVVLDHRVMEYDFCLDNVQNKNGYYLEFGVFEGKSINYMAHRKPQITFHGFDSFDGLPEQWFMGHKVIEKGFFSLKELPNVRNNVNLYEGWFTETIPGWKKNHRGHISFINIDCDLYSSTKTIFDELNDQIVTGTLIRFDDLLTSPIAHYPNWQEGEWKALVEWCKKYNRIVKPLARSWKQGCTVIVEK